MANDIEEGRSLSRTGDPAFRAAPAVPQNLLSSRGGRARRVAHSRVGFPVLCLIRRCGDDVCAGGGCLVGFYDARGSGRRRVSIQPRHSQNDLDLLGNRRVGLAPRFVHLLRRQLPDRSAHRVHVRSRADRRRRAPQDRSGRHRGGSLKRAVGILWLAGLIAYPSNRLTAQVSIHASLGARYSTTLVKDSVVVPIELQPTLAPVVQLSVRDAFPGRWTGDAMLDVSHAGLDGGESGRTVSAGSVMSIARSID